MASREDIKKSMVLIDEEFKNLLPNNDIDISNKINIWSEILTPYPSHILMQATLDIIANHQFKEVRCAHLNAACIKAIEAPAIQFGNRLVEIVDEFKTDLKIRVAVENEFNELGLNVYIANRDNLLFYESTNRDILIKSMSEIYKNKLWIEFNAKKLIEDTKKEKLLNG